MGWLIANWEWCLLGLYVTEKLVKITPFKWDDLVVDGIKEAYNAWRGRPQKSSSDLWE